MMQSCKLISTPVGAVFLRKKTQTFEEIEEEGDKAAVAGEKIERQLHYRPSESHRLSEEKEYFLGKEGDEYDPSALSLLLILWTLYESSFLPSRTTQNANQIKQASFFRFQNQIIAKKIFLTTHDGLEAMKKMSWFYVNVPTKSRLFILIYNILYGKTRNLFFSYTKNFPRMLV